MTRAARTSGSARRSMAYLLAKLQYSAELRHAHHGFLSGARLTFALIVSAIAAGRGPAAARPIRSRSKRCSTAPRGISTTSSIEFENVVAEEHYTQDAVAPAATVFHRSPAAAAAAGAQWRPRTRRARVTAICDPISCWSSRRETEALVPFRDVIDVDGVVGPRPRSAAGEAVPELPRRSTRWRGPNRSARKARATTSATCAARSAIRCSALGVLQRSYQPRFRFSLGKEDRGLGPDVWIVDYKEVASPAMIRGEAGTRSVRPRPPVDRHRHRPRAQDRAAGRTAGDPRGRDHHVPARRTIRHRRAARDARARTRSATATASTRSPPTAASAGSTSAPKRTSTRRAPTDVDPRTGMTLRRVAARALHDGQRVVGSSAATTDETLHDVEHQRAVSARRSTR